jgi:hypothetical protein
VEVRVAEVGVGKERAAEVRPAEGGLGEVRAVEVRTTEVDPREVRPAEVRTVEDRVSETRLIQIDRLAVVSGFLRSAAWMIKILASTSASRSK